MNFMLSGGCPLRIGSHERTSNNETRVRIRHKGYNANHPMGHCHEFPHRKITQKKNVLRIQ